jgi:putative endonuclease
MYYTYVLYSFKDNNFYTGYTEDLNKRLSQHNNGSVQSTRHKQPLKLIYYESCISDLDAKRREKYLKSGNGKIYIRNRLKNYFNNPVNI